MAMFRNTLISACFAITALWIGQARANLVANGDFETGNLNGWTVSPGTADIGIDSTFPNNGNFDAFFGNPPGTLSQSLITVPGTDYVLSFAVFDEFSAFSDTFTVTFGGFSQTITGDQANPSYFTVGPVDVPGSDITAGNTNLSFTGLVDPLLLIPPRLWHLDDVSVTPAAIGVPEPSALVLLVSALIGLMAFALPGWRRRLPLSQPDR
jgi:hypothetical protein